ncbi:MAG TPA: acyl-ACP--UDP-N-acetylglucosamine O-acyltransferase [Nitrospirae bacterium]|nr:acyl-[acyl-carrier-protein]--UDP-N-acetylglucosamine O-acyltransferase [bacterium BMS3Abin09]GBE41035.1 acyl-[acyl-carrier-protein]--UDP-N-acetylglucosamine O-acyltransferase [bacterium BMS3Bbin09]HDO67372.1 acyl-ACP--UDP-N-acetylglucosamine O-acyltransferase [Nitrospirota bacterium]HDZ83584.1 acyl-ACP--UDP-N-acetylglucosamine O-acyltransferase [Nitrospirota bacterium]HEW81546.1 acyl-ACP--UDP-N-acetylglucosamine O-acyltransferase [Nitrospirota bacterium]
MSKPKIHRTAIVDPDAKLAEGVEIGPFCIVGKRVKIGKNTKLNAHIVIEDTEMGSNNTVYPFTTIGLPPQDIKYFDEKTNVIIGNNNIIREYISIHRASVGGDMATRIGNNNFLMAYVHIAHDCNIGNDVVMANATTLAGHVTVEDYVFIGGLVAVHQFTRIGAYSMIGGFSAIPQDVPPFTTAAGERAKLYGLNTVGLKRQKFDDATIKNLKKAYKILFRSKLTLKESIKKLKIEREETKEINYLIEFIEKNKRGVCR